MLAQGVALNFYVGKGDLQRRCGPAGRKQMILGMPKVYWVWNILFLVWGLYISYKVYKIAEKLGV